MLKRETILIYGKANINMDPYIESKINNFLENKKIRYKRVKKTT